MQSVQSVQRMQSVEALKAERRRREIRRSFIYHLGVGIFSLGMLYPLMWLFSSSLKAPSEVWTTVNSLIPNSIHLENYLNGWAGFGGVTFSTFYTNSFIYAGIGTLFTIASSVVVAYGFARLQFRGRQFWFAIMLGTLMLPTQVLIIPQYIIFNKVHWINTFLPLLVPRLGGDV